MRRDITDSFGYGHAARGADMAVVRLRASFLVARSQQAPITIEAREADP